MAYSKRPYVHILIILHYSHVFWGPCTETGSHLERFDRPVCDRERRREAGRKGGREEGREGVKEGGKERGREGEREEGREAGKEGGREGMHM